MTGHGETLRIGSFFSRYGGLDMAVQEVFGGDVVWYSEIDKNACQVLAAHHPGVMNLGDISTVDWTTVPPVDILTGGYPCQPFSQAGQRKGTDDERHLWPYVREAISALRPMVTVLENVDGHRSLGFDTVLGDIAEMGLSARWGVVRAADAGAPHGRKRVFIVVTDPDSEGLQGRFVQSSSVGRAESWGVAAGDREDIEPADSDGSGRVEYVEQPGDECAPQGEGESGISHGHCANGSASDSDRSNVGCGRGRQLEDTHAAVVREWDISSDILAGSGDANDEDEIRDDSGSTAGSGRTRNVTADSSSFDAQEPAWQRSGTRDTGRCEFGDCDCSSGSEYESASDSHNIGCQHSDKSHTTGLAVHATTGSGSTLADSKGAGTGSAVRQGGLPREPGRDSGVAVDWGRYGPAIRRWERLTRPAPAPTISGRNGRPRLSPFFVEWMMGLPAGHVTGHGLKPAAELKMLGNGVCPPQAVLALRMLGYGQ